MKTISPETIDQARSVAEALNAALAKIDNGSVPVGTIPALAPMTLTVDPSVLPSDDVAKAVAASASARTKFESETVAARRVALVLEAGAAIGRAMIPGVGPMLSLIKTFACVLIAASFFALAGCGVASGAVQVGPTSQPAVLAQTDIDVPLASPSLDMQTSAGDVASPSVLIQEQSGDQVTSQPFSATDSGDQRAGRDARETDISVNASGSGWPAVAMFALMMFALSLLAYARLRTGNKTLEGNAIAVAKSIAMCLPRDDSRDYLLNTIERELVNQEAWNQLIEPWRVKRSESLKPSLTAHQTPANR